MKLFRKFTSSLLIIAQLFIQGLLYPLLFVTPAYAVVSGTFTATQTVANVSAVNDQTATTATTVANVVAGTDNQTAVTATPVANVLETKASQTLTVVNRPANAENIVVGVCTVTFLDVAGIGDNSLTAADDLDCTGGATINNYTITNPGVAHTQAEIASVLRSLTNVADATHGSLTVGGSGNGASFTTTNTENSATNITFTNNAGANITNVAVTGIVPVVQVNTITIGGTVDTGDVFTATLPTVGAVNYTVTGTDTTTDNIASGLRAAIEASAGFAGQAFTSSVATNVVTLTAKVAGTGFTQTSGAVNRAAVVQVNTITIGGTVEAGDVFTANLPGAVTATYTATGGDTTTANIATGLNNAILASTNYATQGFTSGVATNVVTLTANVAGTGFTQTSGTTNRSPVAQVVTFTPGGTITAGETFRGTINGTNYDYLAVSGNTVATVVAALATSMDAHAAVACVDTTSTTVTCTASSAGTSFTYAGIVVDVTAPAALTAGSVVTTGGTIVANKWNSTNTGVDIVVPVANDSTLTGGTIQLQAEADGTFENLGAAYTILIGDLNTNKTLSRTEANLEGLTGFSNGDNITFRAIITDSNTNATTSSNSTTSLDVDQATPTFTAVRTASGTVVVTFNENVSASAPNETTAWTVSGATGITAVSQPSSALTLTLTVTGLTGTSETPVVTYVAASGTVLDSAGNEVANSANATATDGVAPTLAEVTPISALTNDSTPDYIFSSSEAGTITYAGGCTGNTSASAGNNTKTFNALADGTYGSCTIRVTDSANNQSSLLSVSSFTVDATAPNAPSITTVATDNRINSSEKSAIVVVGSAEANSFVTATLTDSATTVKTGTQQLSGGATNYSITIDGTTATALVDGNLAVNVTARDGANNTSVGGTATVPLDTVAPVFSLVTPADSASIKNVTTSSSIAYTLDTAIVSGSVIMTRTAGTADASSPRTCTLVGTALNSGAHTLDLSDTTNGCSVAQTLVDGAVYTFVFNGVDLAGNSATTITRTGVTYDTTSPTAVVTYSLNRAVKAGETLTITATFNEAITNTPQIAISGSNTVSATNMTSSSSTVFTYTHTVGTGNGSSTLALSVGTDSAGNVVTATPASGSTFTVDNTASTITNVTSTLADGSYKAGQVVSVAVTFSEAVNVTGTPQIQLETGTTDRIVDYTSGSGSNTLTFNYTVSATDTTSDLDYLATNSLTLNSGTIKDTATNDATLTLVSPAGVGSLGANKALVIDTTVPVITLVSPTASTAINSTTTATDITYSLSETLVSGATLVFTRTAGTGTSNYTCTLAGTALSVGTNKTLDTSDTVNGCSSAVALDNGTTYTITVNGSDAANNAASTVTVTGVIFDTVAPASATISVNSGATYTNSTSVSLAISATDATSTVTQMNVYNGSGFNSANWETIATTKSWTLPSTEGVKTVNIRFRDAAGNENSTFLAQDDITLDQTAPTISAVTLTNLTTSNNTYVKNTDSIRLTATITDTNQGTFATSNPTNIFANLSNLGGGTAVNPTSYNTSTGIATWASVSVSGTSEANASVTVDATDGATNAATQGSATINGNNSTPVATADNVTAVKNTALTITTSSLLTNDTDAGSDSLSFVGIGTTVSHGTVSVSGSNITYTPTTDYLGSDSFTYTVTDGSLTSSAGTVNITVNAPVSTGQVLLQPTQTVSSSTPQIVVGTTTTDSIITIPDGVNNASLDLSNLVTTSGTNKNVTLTNKITLNATSSLGTVNVQIPSGIVITGGSGTWNGTVNAPQIQSLTSVTLPKSDGADINANAVIEVGYGDVPLTFNKAVRLVIPSQAGKVAAYSRSGVLTTISSVCSADTQAAGDALSDGADCKIDVGSDLVIWTKHFTKFVAYTVNTFSPASVEGATYNTTPPACTDSKPTSAPSFVSAVAGTNSVTLTWNSASGSVSYYLITYGNTSGSQTYGNPNVGGSGTTNYTVNGLSGGSTYYFRIRAGNGCTPGDYSGEISATPGGGFVEGPAGGFAEGVLGITSEDQAAIEGEQSGEIKGESSASSEQASVAPQAKTGNSGFPLKTVAIIAIVLMLGFGLFRLIFK